MKWDSGGVSEVKSMLLAHNIGEPWKGRVIALAKILDKALAKLAKDSWVEYNFAPAMFFGTDNTTMYLYIKFRVGDDYIKRVVRSLKGLEYKTMKIERNILAIGGDIGRSREKYHRLRVEMSPPADPFSKMFGEGTVQSIKKIKESLQEATTAVSHMDWFKAFVSYRRTPIKLSQEYGMDKAIPIIKFLDEVFDALKGRYSIREMHSYGFEVRVFELIDRIAVGQGLVALFRLSSDQSKAEVGGRLIKSVAKQEGMLISKRSHTNSPNTTFEVGYEEPREKEPKRKDPFSAMFGEATLKKKFRYNKWIRDLADPKNFGMSPKQYASKYGEGGVMAINFVEELFHDLNTTHPFKYDQSELNALGFRFEVYRAGGGDTVVTIWIDKVNKPVLEYIMKVAKQKYGWSSFRNHAGSMIGASFLPMKRKDPFSAMFGEKKFV